VSARSMDRARGRLQNPQPQTSLLLSATSATKSAKSGLSVVRVFGTASGVI
jgi:hypothetical protein